MLSSINKIFKNLIVSKKTVPICMPLEVTLKCKVTAGRGQARTERQYEIKSIEKLKNISLVQGSLNLIANTPIYFNESANVYRYNEHMFFEGKLNDTPVFVNRWKGAPAHIFEIFATQHLRKSLALHNGQTVNLAIPSLCLDNRRNQNIKNKLIWIIYWKFRESLFYSSKYYPYFMRTKWRARYGWRANQ